MTIKPRQDKSEIVGEPGNKARLLIQDPISGDEWCGLLERKLNPVDSSWARQMGV